MIIALLGMTIPEALYILDYKNEYVNHKTKLIIACKSDRDGTRIFTDNGKAFRIFRENKEKFEDLDDAFINHTCDIYYYRMSKYVYRIIVLEEDN